MAGGELVAVPIFRSRTTLPRAVRPFGLLSALWEFNTRQRARSARQFILARPYPRRRPTTVYPGAARTDREKEQAFAGEDDNRAEDGPRY